MVIEYDFRVKDHPIPIIFSKLKVNNTVDLQADQTGY